MSNFKRKKHKQSKYFTLMLVPYSSQKTKSIRIPHNLIYTVSSIVVAILLFVGFSHIRTNMYKNSLNNAIEKTEQLIEENANTEEKLKKQKDDLKNQTQTHKKELNQYEKNLDQYEEKAIELETKIEELNKQKDDIYNLLSQKVGKDLSIVANVSDTNENSTNGYTFLSSSLLLMNTPKNNIPPTLDQKYSDLEKRLENQKNEYEILLSAVHKYKPYIDAVPNMLPVYGNITSGFGGRSNPFSGYGAESHLAVDIKASTGTPVKVTGKGVVSFAGYQGGYGYLIVVDHGYGLQTKYAHNSKLAVNVGDVVYRGNIVAYSGSTGRSTGPHVHYEVLKDSVSVNPFNYIQ